MTQFDYEMELFEEIINKYKPIRGCHLLLDLDAYKQGQEILTKFAIGSDEYHKVVNIEYNEKQKEKVIITSNIKNGISYNSKILYARYDCNKRQIVEFEDLTPNPYKLKRTLEQQMELLVYELNNPKPSKPIC